MKPKVRRTLVWIGRLSLLSQALAWAAQTPILPSGEQTYFVRQSEEIWPKFEKAIIHPPDVHVGDKQILTAVLRSTVAIVSVKAHIETDHGFKDLTLHSSKEAPLTFTNSWIVQDTHDRYYKTVFVAKDANGRVNRITMAWSDACGIPYGGDWTLTTPCTISSTDGVDNGNATITTGGTLTLNATFGWNAGKSIFITGTGTILMGSGGQLKQTYLWMTDADNDGYAPTVATQYAQDTQPAGTRRRKDIVGGNDCNDSNASLWQNLAGYPDSDGDNYGSGSVQQVCSGASLPAPYRVAGGDCCEIDTEVHPNQTSYYTSEGACGGYDYDCNGFEEKGVNTYTDISACATQAFGFCSLFNCQDTVCNKAYGNAATPGCGQTYANFDSADCYGNNNCSHCPSIPTGACNWQSPGNMSTVDCH